MTDFDASLTALCADCFAAMYASGGVGIAAPQLGVPARLFVYNTDPTAPGGLDIYFDNVGGRVLEAALDHANTRARVVICGMISQYNLTREDTPGIRNLPHINRKRIRMEGFIVSDHEDRRPEFEAEMIGWLKSGAIKYRVDVAEGLENAPAAMIAMLKGENFGKQVVRVGAEP